MAYVKNHNPWTAADLLTGRIFNHLETQWNDIKAEADVHLHDASYYPNAASGVTPNADNTFFSLTFKTGFDADKVDDKHYSELVTGSMPLGAIVYWPSESTPPTGWHICDGTTVGAVTTPNLVDKFIVGAGTTYDPGDTGGAATQAIAGTITVGDHSVTAAETPQHTHTYSDVYNSSTACGFSYTQLGQPTGTNHADTRDTANAGNGVAHTHTGNSITLDALDVLPAYYAMYLIMKVV